MLSFEITVKMANLSSVVSRVQNPTCTICRGRLQKQNSRAEFEIEYWNLLQYKR